MSKRGLVVGPWVVPALAREEPPRAPWAARRTPVPDPSLLSECEEAGAPL